MAEAIKIVRAPSVKNNLFNSDYMSLAEKGEGHAPSPGSVSQDPFHTTEDPRSDE